MIEAYVRVKDAALWKEELQRVRTLIRNKDYAEATVYQTTALKCLDNLESIHADKYEALEIVNVHKMIYLRVLTEKFTTREEKVQFIKEVSFLHKFSGSPLLQLGEGFENNAANSLVLMPLFTV